MLKPAEKMKLESMILDRINVKKVVLISNIKVIMILIATKIVLVD